MSKSNVVKLISAILCVAIIVATICVVLFVSDNNKKPALVYDTESGAKLDTDSVQNMPKGLTFISDAETFSATSVSLTATVLPTTAVNKALDWSIAWAEPNGWASGKTVTDYVGFTSNNNVATVTFKKLFNVKAVITATSKDNPSAKASCNIDCAKRLLSTSIVSKTLDKVTWNFNSPTPVLSLLPVQMMTNNPWILLQEPSNTTVTYDYQYSEGTIDNAVTSMDIGIVASDALEKGIHENSGGPYIYTYFMPADNVKLGSEYFPNISYATIVKGLCGVLRTPNDITKPTEPGPPFPSVDPFTTTKYNKFVEILQLVKTEDFTLTVTANMKYGDPVTTVFKCRFDRTKGPFAVSDVNFDNGGLVL